MANCVLIHVHGVCLELELTSVKFTGFLKAFYIYQQLNRYRSY